MPLYVLPILAHAKHPGRSLLTHHLPTCPAAFLLTEDLQFNTSAITAEEATGQANAFSCASCGHTSASPLPVFPTHEDCCKVVKARPPTCSGQTHLPAKNRQALRWGPARLPWCALWCASC